MNINIAFTIQRMINHYSRFVVVCFFTLISVLSLVNAQKKNDNTLQSSIPIFKEIDSSTSGIKFLNLTPGPPDLKKESRLFTIASGGTSVGDINGDGLIDIYLTSFHP